MNRTLDETKRGLQCLVNLGNDDCDFPHCNKCHLYVAGYTSTEIISDVARYVQQLEADLEKEKLMHQDTFEHAKMFEERFDELTKAELENRLIILPYSPGTQVYIVDNYEVIPVKYHPSMYGRRCNISKEKLYEEFYQELKGE